MEFYISVNQKNSAKKKGKLYAKSRTTSGKRAHHNVLEQKRRGVIRGCFETLRKSVPTMDSGKKLSRSGILRETARYIKTTRERMAGYQADIDELRLQNQLLSNELECLEALPSETSLVYKDFDSLTKGLNNDKQKIQNSQSFNTRTMQMEIIQIGESKTGNMFPDSFMNSYQNSASSTDIFLMERSLLKHRGCFDSSSLQQERKMLDQKFKEDLHVDVEGFEQEYFSLYDLSRHLDV